MCLRTKVLATTRTTRAQDLATARGLLASKETVATRTHEIARLECPLHIILELINWRAHFSGAAPIKMAARHQATAIIAARLSEGSARVKKLCILHHPSKGSFRLPRYNPVIARLRLDKPALSQQGLCRSIAWQGGHSPLGRIGQNRGLSRAGSAQRGGAMSGRTWPAPLCHCRPA